MQKKSCSNCNNSFCNSLPNDEYGDLIWLECEILKKVVDEDDAEKCQYYQE